MKIKIIKASAVESWYKNEIGKEFAVIEEYDFGYVVKEDATYKYIVKTYDCEISKKPTWLSECTHCKKHVKLHWAFMSSPNYKFTLKTLIEVENTKCPNCKTRLHVEDRFKLSINGKWINLYVGTKH